MIKLTVALAITCVCFSGFAQETNEEIADEIEVTVNTPKEDTESKEETVQNLSFKPADCGCKGKDKSGNGGK